VPQTSRRAGEATAAVAPELASDALLVSLVFADDDEVQALNKQWRAKDKPTNVLSFPMLSREAADKGVPVEAHATHLIVHGLLHLAGYDHETGAAEASQMEALETKALAMLGLADPYGAD